MLNILTLKFLVFDELFKTSKVFNIDVVTFSGVPYYYLSYSKLKIV